MTRLKALELFGFKSFADRTRFEFPDGITVVVGPNGSGKSNVVDAIKWVLGEQSVRSLRGREMTDVIFAGSVSRKPLNSAETSLVFDNSARLLPVEADEVQIGRRVYRSGESEYLINGEVCRLRDIRDLFSGTGAATEAYSVIEQGRVDALLMASGKDRRAVFEEAAGITKFRARRTESLRRLERAEQNRQRLADIVGEVAARLETVRHQAARARRWRQMTDRLRRLRLVAARQDLAEVDGAVAAVESTLARLHANLEATETAATEAAAEASARGLEDQELVPQVTQLRGVVTAERERAAAAEARRQPLLERMGEWEGELARIEQEGRTSAALLRSAVDAATAAATSSSALTAERGALEERLTACQQAAAGSNSDVEQARTRVEHLAKRLEDLAAQRQRLLLEADRADGRQEEARRQAAESRLRIDTARRRMDTTAEALAAREGNLQALVQRLEATGRDIGAAEESVRERTVALESGWRELAGWQAKLEACRERRGLLEEFAGRHEGVAEAARRLLVAAAADAEGSAVRGIVGEMIDAPMEWASLVDVALGVTAQDIAVTSLDRFAGWLQPWAGTEAGKGALATGGRIGIVAPGPILTADDPDLAADGGVVGRLDRLIASAAATAADTPAAWLLGQTWVVATFDDARRLAAAHSTLRAAGVAATKWGVSQGPWGWSPVGPSSSPSICGTTSSCAAAMTTPQWSPTSKPDSRRPVRRSASCNPAASTTPRAWPPPRATPPASPASKSRPARPSPRRKRPSPPWNIAPARRSASATRSPPVSGSPKRNWPSSAASGRGWSSRSSTSTAPADRSPRRSSACGSSSPRAGSGSTGRSTTLPHGPRRSRSAGRHAS